jgi:hypothetical protein
MTAPETAQTAAIRPLPGPAPWVPLTLAALLLTGGCGGGDSLPPEGTPERVVHDAIEAHGGDRFRSVQLAFVFRGDPFVVVYDEGRFAFERTRPALDEGLPPGATLVDRMDNEGTTRTVGGTPVPLDPETLHTLETDVNSVVYFAFLPWRLQDPAVRLRDLGETTLNDEPYRKVEVTFETEGGGRDWEDRFIYWFHRETHFLDFMAYRYHTGEGGTRFRQAVNRREVGDLVVQDWLNFTADPDVDDVARYDELYREGSLRAVSRIELEGLRVTPPPR